MAELRTERTSVLDYLRKNKFVIPFYQRGYVWSEDECEQLWDDILNFYSNKDKEEDSEYFLGCVVMFKENGRQNIIDGQQRTTTLSLLIRALYEKAVLQNADKVQKLVSDLSSCLWEINKLSGEIDFKALRLTSAVAIDSDNDLLADILGNTYEAKDNSNQAKSNYETNYLFFKNKIEQLSKEKPVEWLPFCLCLLNDCIILPIECDGQENALRIFNTLNNRGVSLSPADIFKGLIYQSKDKQGGEKFAKEWKELESKISDSNYLKRENIGFLFNQYEHIIRAQKKELDTVIPSTLEFFTKKDKLNSKKKRVNFAANENYLAKNETFEFIQKLGEFWCDPKAYMSKEAQKYFDILNIYQNQQWQMVVSMCYNKILENKAGIEIFDRILPQLASYLAIALIYNKGGNSGIFWGLMKANINIDKAKEKVFDSGLAIPDVYMPKLEYFVDFSSKAIAKQIRYILAIFTLANDAGQEWEWNKNEKNYSVIKGEIEHILPKKWQSANYQGWNEEDAKKYLEQIGNKMLLEKKLNIEAGNGYFNKKKEVYKNSHFKEAKALAGLENADWTPENIEQRNEKIYRTLDKFFKENLGILRG